MPTSNDGSDGVYKGLPIRFFATLSGWEAWLKENHLSSPGVWTRVAKKAAAYSSASYAELVDGALCYGWIDGQKASYDESSYLQRFTPRKPKSGWSKTNRKRALALIDEGRMTPSGLSAIEAARANGQWDAAYDSASSAPVPADLADALDASPRAKEFFGALSSANRYAILYRLQTAKRPETRAARLAKFIGMLEKHETIHPQ